MPGGRPTKYEPVFAKRAYEFSLLGATMEQMADFFEVHRDTLYEWIKEYPEFSDALKRGGMLATAKVVKSMYKSAIGIKYVETTVEEDEEGNVKRKTVNKYIPPNTGAAVYITKNKFGSVWRDKQVVEQSGPNGDPVKVEHVIKFEDMGSDGSETK